MSYHKKRYDKLLADRRTHDHQWEEIALYMMPWKADFITDRSKGDKARGKDIYDPTAAVSANVLSSHMYTSLTSPSAKWFELKFRTPEANRNDEAKEWIEDCTLRMFNAINDSNFANVIGQTYKDLVVFGTACLEVTHVNTERDGFKLVFKSIALQNSGFIENVHGHVDTVYHKFKMSAKQAMELFGDKAPKKIQEAVKNDRQDELYEFLRCVEPNNKWVKNSLKDDERAFISTWCFEGKDFMVTGFYEQPFMVPRWDKITEETYGFGPGTLSLPDVRTINKAKSLELRSWEKAIDPPMAAMANGVIGDIHIEAGGLTQVRDTRALTPISDTANWQAVQIKSQELRTNIQSIFLIDQLILPERPNATATEVTIRYEMMQKVLGGVFGNIQAELLNPLVQRIFGIMFRNGQLQDAPEDLDEGEYDVKYTGPLAKAQTSARATGIERLMNYLIVVGQMDQSVFDAVDMVKATLVLADQWDVPAEVTRGEAENAEIQQGRAQAQAEAQQKEDAMAQAQIEGQQAQTNIANVEAMRNVAGQY